jgi:ribonucleoside-diphosphate reductase alpha chain
MNQKKTKHTRYNKLSLIDLTNAAQSNKKIDISNNSSMQANQITIIKRSGRREAFMSEKLKRVCLWATDGNEYYANELIADTEIKLHEEINIKDMFQQLINTAVNKISMLYPMWEDFASKLELIKIYKETYNISNINEYPHIKDVLAKGLSHKIYDYKSVHSYSSEEIEEINAAIKPERDFLFNYKGLVTFFDKYSLNYTKTRKLELPQHSYMRIAMALMINEKNRVQHVIKEYDALSKHLYTRATPIMLNALTPGQQLSSCVLNTVNDDSHSILDTGKNIGIYSKFKGGTALDISSIRGKGSYIEGTQGFSSGPVPFVKFFESIVKAWNQGGKRQGSLAIYFNWWHIDVFDILSLKSNGGTDENRARGLQYACKINQYLIDAFIHDKDVVLFDPKDVPDLIGKFGDEFENVYSNYINKTQVHRKTIRARDLFEKLFKERSETGNIYLFHEENVNETTLLNRYIGSSNLCTEIVLPSRASTQLDEELLVLENGEKRITKQYTSGEIALCNLSSLNAEKWFYMSDEEKQSTVETLVRGLDNTIDIANYPVKEGKNSNAMYRYLGIGILNQTNYLALKGIVIDTQESAEEQDKLWDEISYMLISTSVDLAIEKGKFEKFYETEWSKGILPIHKANKNAVSLTSYEPDCDKWNKLSERVKNFGIRNAQLMAIAPTACQTKYGDIQTNDGVKTLEQIMDEQGIDHKSIEKNGIQHWINFRTPQKIPTDFGEKEVQRIWYNGMVPTKKITFEDGKTYEFSLNHMLLAKLDDNSEDWAYINDLKENMEIINVIDGATKIANIDDGFSHTWDIEVPAVHEYILGNGCISHNTSGKAINAIESIEPIHDFFYKEEGTITVPTVVPNFRKNNKYYKRAFECDQFALIKNAAVRQKWIDQAQSVNVYIPKPDSLLDMAKLHLYGFHYGMKTFYYLRQQKESQSSVCESCT